jgi:hypothetical protein
VVIQSYSRQLSILTIRTTALIMCSVFNT